MATIRSTSAVTLSLNRAIGTGSSFTIEKSYKGYFAMFLLLGLLAAPSQLLAVGWQGLVIAALAVGGGIAIARTIGRQGKV